MSRRPWRSYIPGKHAPSLRALWLRQRHRCAYCRRDTDLPPGGENGNQRREPGALYASRDHKQPTSLGGTNSPDNLAMACEPCNQFKRDMPWADWVDFMAAYPGWWESPAAARAAREAADSSIAASAVSVEVVRSWGLAARNRIPNPVMTAEQTAAWLARGGDFQTREDQNGAHDVP